MAEKEKNTVPEKTPLVFYKTPAGREVVREWLKSLPQPDRQQIGDDLMRAQWRWPVGMPLCRPMGQGFYEVRSTLPSRRIARVLLCFHLGKLWALHGFIKKTEKTDADDLELGRKRMKEVLRS